MLISHFFKYLRKCFDYTPKVTMLKSIILVRHNRLTRKMIGKLLRALHIHDSLTSGYYMSYFHCKLIIYLVYGIPF